ncbi:MULTISPECIES: ABC transporter ATP-binding protein [Haloferax]|nr:MULTISPECIES: ABC transporter ATP-binding protein [Haloferax]
MNETPVLEIRNLEKYFTRKGGFLDSLFGSSKEPIRAVDDVSLALDQNEVQGIIGESGCGKSTLLKTVIGLTDPTGGDIFYKGKPLSEFSKRDWKEFRKNVQIIFQNPFESLDPKFTVRESLIEPLKIHDIEYSEERIHDALDRVQLNPPQKYLDRLPKQLSGGEKQRVSIARAIIVEPDVILADEPVSMLDVSTQAAILRLLSDLTEELGLSMLYISHDLSTVSDICDLIHVMYLGRVVETAPTNQILGQPRHPYSQALIDAIPIPDPFSDRPRTALDGSPPSPEELEAGCRFKDRCPERMPRCDTAPKKVETDPDQFTACHLHYEESDSRPNTEAALQGGNTQ